jgi:hypothetical protein
MAIQQARESMVGNEEPLNSEDECKVVQHGASLFVCVTSYGQKTHSIEKGDKVTVHTYADRIEIEPSSGD